MARGPRMLIEVFTNKDDQLGAVLMRKAKEAYFGDHHSNKLVVVDHPVT